MVGPGESSGRSRHRSEQLLQAREAELHLGLDADDLADLPSVRVFDQVLDQSRLADPRLAAQDERLRLAGAPAAQQTRQESALVRPSDQIRCAGAEGGAIGTSE